MQIGSREGVGRVLIAARAYRAGDLVLLDEGLVRCPHERTDPVCLHCCDYVDAVETSGAPRRKCEGCDLPFCSAACEEAAGPYHALECGLLSAASLQHLAEELGLNKELLWLGLRALIRDAGDARAAADGAERPEPLRSAIAGLETHEAHVDGEYRAQLLAAAQALAAAFACAAEGLLPAALENALPPETLVRVFLAQGVNGIDIGQSFPDRPASGTGIFCRASLFAHTCDSPNCHYQGESGAVAVRAARDVAEGEELTIAYVALDRWTAVRRLALLRSKFFLCECPRCLSPSEGGRYAGAVRCKAKGCAGYLLQAPLPAPPDGRLPEPEEVLEAGWRCEACGAEVPHEAVDGDLRRASAFLDRSDAAWQGGRDVDAAAEWTDRYLTAVGPRLLHPCHFLTGRALSHRMRQAALQGDFAKTTACADQALERIARVFPEAAALERADLQHEAAVALVMASRRLPPGERRAAGGRAEALLREAEAAFRILAGPDSKRLRNMRRAFTAVLSDVEQQRIVAGAPARRDTG